MAAIRRWIPEPLIPFWAEQQRAYGKALETFAAWVREHAPDGFTKKPRCSATEPLSRRKASRRNGLLDPHLAAAIVRVKGAAQKGRRLGRWLTREEPTLLLHDRKDPTLKGKRNRAILCLLIGSGLCREELAGLNVEHIQQREGRWAIIDLMGKRKRIRTVPIPAWAKAVLDRWTESGRHR